MKIGVVITSYGAIDPHIYRNHLSALLHWNKQFDIDVFHLPDMQQYSALNSCTDNAIANGCDFILYVEHDNTYYKELLSDLLKSDKDIITGYYTFRNWPFVPIPIVQAEDGKMYRVEYIPNGMDSLMRVSIGCFGCCLVKTSVLKKLEYPYFRCEYNEKKQATILPDVCFFNDARKAGFDIWCDGMVRNGHMAHPLKITADNYRIYQKLLLLGFPDMVSEADRLSEEERLKQIKEMGLLNRNDYT
jgi:hypothetical protein